MNEVSDGFDSTFTIKTHDMAETYIDGVQIRHKIYQRILSILENRRSWLIRKSQASDPVFGYPMVVYDWEVVTDVPAALYAQLERIGQTFLIENIRAVPVPNFVLNGCLCEDLEKRFSRAELLACPGFVSLNGSIRLSLDPIYSKRGFMLPVVWDRYITALQVFRNPNDNRPFVLDSRQPLREADGW